MQVPVAPAPGPFKSPGQATGLLGACGELPVAAKAAGQACGSPGHAGRARRTTSVWAQLVRAWRKSQPSLSRGPLTVLPWGPELLSAGPGVVLPPFRAVRPENGDVTWFSDFPPFDGFSYILFLFPAKSTPPSVFPLVPCCTKTGSPPPDTSLACLVTGYLPSPVKITWNSGKVTQGVKNFPEVTMSDGLHTRSSLLILPDRSRQGDTYQCDVTHEGTAKTVSKKFLQECKTCGVGRTGQPACLRSSLDPTIYLTKPSYEDVIKNSGHVTCLVLGYDLAASKIAWKVDGQVSSAAKTEPLKKNSNGTTSLVSSHPVSLAQWGQGTKFTCKVTTPCSGELTQEITMSNTVTISRAYHEDISGNRISLTLICEASGFYPEEISISWLKNNLPELKSSYNNGPVSGSGTFSAYSILKVDKSGGAVNYTCVVHHPAMEEWFTEKFLSFLTMDPGGSCLLHT
uniref:Ig-like domain-containing protein n=1 Tax=Terrapene triunguis TaxID=2587831 RepID=A0A674I7J3_9SAUR